MKLGAATIDRFVDAPDPRIRAVLVYGPDRGLVRELASRLARAVVPDAGDPFRVAEFAASALRDQPYLLADEAAAIAMGGGRRVVQIREATDAAAELVEVFLADPKGDALVVIEAGDLGPRSRLRRLFEEAGAAAAIPCYADQAPELNKLIREVLAEDGLTASPDALGHLMASLGGDRMISRRELEKLMLYVGPGNGTVALDDAVACIGDSAALQLDDLAFAVGDRDAAAVLRATARLFAEGESPVRVLGAATRHCDRLHRAVGLVAAGRSVEQAMHALAPPVFFKRRARFARQIGVWAGPQLVRALTVLTEAEALCKTTGMPAETVCTQAVLSLCRKPA